MVELLLQNGVDVSGVFCYSNTLRFWQWSGPLEVACAKGHLAIVQRLLRHGDDKGAKLDMSGGLAGACEGGHAAVVKELLEQGAPATDYELHRACVSGSEACARLLLQHGARVKPGVNRQATVLHSACASGQEACVELLL